MAAETIHDEVLGDIVKDKRLVAMDLSAMIAGAKTTATSTRAARFDISSGADRGRNHRHERAFA